MVAAMKKMAFGIFCWALLMLAPAPAWGADQCSEPSGGRTGTGPVGHAVGPDTCGVVITVTGVDGNGKATFFTVAKPGTGNGNPYDGTDDTLVGIQNNTTSALRSITLTAPHVSGKDDLFAFGDNDGPCVYQFGDGQRYLWCDAGGARYGYEGPDNTFSITDDTTTGTVNFPGDGVEANGSTWFALEGTPDSLTSITQTQGTPPGVPTVFNFGPFNFISAPAASTQNGNMLSITAVPIPSGTQINFADGTHGNCITYSNTDGNCRAFDIQCSGPDCSGTYFAEFSTAYDVDHTIQFPGLAKGEPDCGNIPNTTFTNQIDFFDQSPYHSDPTTKGRSGGTASCWIAVEKVNYPNSDLSITKVGPLLVKSGAPLPYGIAVLNLGPGTATAVTVTDPIPAGTAFLNSAVCFTGKSGVTCQSGAQSPCVSDGSVVTCTLGNLLPFSLKTLAAIGIQLNFTAPASSGTVTNTAAVSGISPDPRMGNNTSTWKTKVK